MDPGFRPWLEQQKYVPKTVQNQIAQATRVEEYHGSLDEHYSKDRMESLIQLLRYSTDDKRRNRPNPSRMPIGGDLHDNLAAYKTTVGLYQKFSDSRRDGTDAPAMTDPKTAVTGAAEEALGQRIGLERDMQAALRREIEQLEPGLTIVDEGAERFVDSGFIDITARDASGTTVVIELKAGSAGQRAIAQILSYMGDVAAEDEGGTVRGILVASEFDTKAKAAAKMVPNLVLRKYLVRFLFSDGYA
jgi:hypothetical protein